jgi:hypothetical protein
MVRRHARSAQAYLGVGSGCCAILTFFELGLVFEVGPSAPFYLLS